METGPWRDALNPSLLRCGSPFSGWPGRGWVTACTGQGLQCWQCPGRVITSPAQPWAWHAEQPADSSWHVSSPSCLHPGSHLAPFPGPQSPKDRLLLQSSLGRLELVVRMSPNPLRVKWTPWLYIQSVSPGPSVSPLSHSVPAGKSLSPLPTTYPSFPTITPIYFCTLITDYLTRWLCLCVGGRGIVALRAHYIQVLFSARRCHSEQRVDMVDGGYTPPVQVAQPLISLALANFICSRSPDFYMSMI